MSGIERQKERRSKGERWKGQIEKVRKCESPPWLQPWGWQWSFLYWWIRPSQDLFLSLWAALGPPSEAFHRTLPALHCPLLLEWCSRISTSAGSSVCPPSQANHAAHLWTQPICPSVSALMRVWGWLCCVSNHKGHCYVWNSNSLCGWLTHNLLNWWETLKVCTCMCVCVHGCACW